MREALVAYTQPDVLVCDEVGYLTYGTDAANVLFHVVNERHLRRRSMIFTTNKHTSRWGSVLHDPDLARAIVDRILERGRIVVLDGPSGRTRHLPHDELDPDEHAVASRGLQAAPADVQGSAVPVLPTGARVSGKPGADFPEPTRPARWVVPQRLPSAHAHSSATVWKLTARIIPRMCGSYAARTDEPALRGWIKLATVVSRSTELTSTAADRPPRCDASRGASRGRRPARPDRHRPAKARSRRRDLALVSRPVARPGRLSSALARQAVSVGSRASRRAPSFGRVPLELRPCKRSSAR